MKSEILFEVDEKHCGVNCELLHFTEWLGVQDMEKGWRCFMCWEDDVDYETDYVDYETDYIDIKPGHECPMFKYSTKDYSSQYLKLTNSFIIFFLHYIKEIMWKIIYLLLK